MHTLHRRRVRVRDDHASGPTRRVSERRPPDPFLSLSRSLCWRASFAPRTRCADNATHTLLAAHITAPVRPVRSPRAARSTTLRQCEQGTCPSARPQCSLSQNNMCNRRPNTTSVQQPSTAVPLFTCQAPRAAQAATCGQLTAFEAPRRRRCCSRKPNTAAAQRLLIHALNSTRGRRTLWTLHLAARGVVA